MQRKCQLLKRNITCFDGRLFINGLRNCPSSKMSQYSVVFCRHGQSVSNATGYIAGWHDVKLTSLGQQQATEAGRILKKRGYKFDVAFCSVLIRAKDTLAKILEEMGLQDVQVIETWRLNETHFGDLTGKERELAMQHVGKEKYAKVQNGYYEELPPLTSQNPLYNEIINNPGYSDTPPDALPMWECLPMNMKRSIPFWENNIVPYIRANKQVLVVSHKHTLRGIAKHLEDMPDDAVQHVEIPNAAPFLYNLDKNIKAVGSFKFLVDSSVR